MFFQSLILCNLILRRFWYMNNILRNTGVMSRKSRSVRSNQVCICGDCVCVCVCACLWGRWLGFVLNVKWQSEGSICLGNICLPAVHLSLPSWGLNFNVRRSQTVNNTLNKLYSVSEGEKYYGKKNK